MLRFNSTKRLLSWSQTTYHAAYAPSQQLTTCILPNWHASSQLDNNDTPNHLSFPFSNTVTSSSMNPISKYTSLINNKNKNKNRHTTSKTTYSSLFSHNVRYFANNTSSGGNARMLKKPKSKTNSSNKSSKSSNNNKTKKSKENDNTTPATTTTTDKNTAAMKNTNDDLPPEYHGLRRKRTSHPKMSPDNYVESGSDVNAAAGTSEYEDLDDEYIPEMDWDHTRFHDHYDRIWEEPKAPPTFKEKIYNWLLRLTSFTAISIAIGSVAFGAFIYMKMRGQLRHVNKTQKLMRKTRKIFSKNPAMIPLSFETMDVKDIKNELIKYVDKENGDGNGKLNLKTLGNECGLWKELLDNGVDINRIADWQNLGVADVEDTTYVLALLQYFLAQSRRKGTPVKSKKTKKEKQQQL